LHSKIFAFTTAIEYDCELIKCLTSLRPNSYYFICNLLALLGYNLAVYGSKSNFGISESRERHLVACI